MLLARRIDGMKRRSTTHVVVQQPHNSGQWRRAVDFIGIDVHKKESQVCISYCPPPTGFS